MNKYQKIAVVLALVLAGTGNFFAGYKVGSKADGRKETIVVSLRTNIVDLTTEKAKLARQLVAATNATTVEVTSLKTQAASLYTQIGDLTAKVESLGKGKAEAEKLMEESTNQVTALTHQVGALTNRVELLLCKVRGLEQLSNTVAALKAEGAELARQLAAATNIVATATGANIIAVVATATNSVVFYQDGTITTTNAPVGMVAGFPVLIDNVSRKTVTLTLKRVVGRGSITMEVNSTSFRVIDLLSGQYACTWRIKGRTEVAGSCTMTVSKGNPADLVVGKGVFNATLTLADE